jgi:hypothetical protein
VTAPTITRIANGSVVLRFPYDADLVESLKARVPGHARKYDPITKAWTVTAMYVPVAFWLMVETFGDVEIVDTASAGSADRDRHAGEDPWTILHLRPTAPPELVTAAHRCLAKLHHPDRGGTTAVMQEINAAAEALRGGR